MDPAKVKVGADYILFAGRHWRIVQVVAPSRSRADTWLCRAEDGRLAYLGAEQLMKYLPSPRDSQRHHSRTSPGPSAIIIAFTANEIEIVLASLMRDRGLNRRRPPRLSTRQKLSQRHCEEAVAQAEIDSLADNRRVGEETGFVGVNFHRDTGDVSAGAAVEPAAEVRAAIERRFGSFNNWSADFIASAINGAGWGCSCSTPINGKLYKVVSDEHAVGLLRPSCSSSSAPTSTLSTSTTKCTAASRSVRDSYVRQGR